jgi:hypothetical protein
MGIIDLLVKPAYPRVTLKKVESNWQRTQRLQTEASRRMPESLQEPYDYSQRVGQSQRADYDFTF